jgi:hypothetical protein
MTPAIVYARFSPRPNAGESMSIETQLDRCRAYCKGNDAPRQQGDVGMTNRMKIGHTTFIVPVGYSRSIEVDPQHFSCMFRPDARPHGSIIRLCGQEFP